MRYAIAEFALGVFATAQAFAHTGGWRLGWAVAAGFVFGAGLVMVLAEIVEILGRRRP